jgi:ATP-dependent RNA helicase DeaD
MVIITRSELRKIHAIEKKIQQQFISKKIPTGLEICEIQLYHLANKIKNTEVDDEVNQFLPAIKDVLVGLDREELIKKIVSVEFSRFYDYYNRTNDLNANDLSEGRSRGKRDPADAQQNGSVRYFINVGEKDGYDWMSLKDFLRDTLDVNKDDIYKVDVKDSFSFFNTDGSLSEGILSTFRDFKVDGRFVNVEISQNPGGSAGGGGRRSRENSKGRRRGDRSYDRSGGKRRGASGIQVGSRRSGKKKSKKRDGFF